MEHWSVVANIKKSLPYGTGGETEKSGTKMFKAGAKVYIVGAFWGTCQNIVVIGQHRKSGRFISCILSADTIENLRVKKIYRPQILEFLQEFKPNGAQMTKDKVIADELFTSLPSWVNNL